MGLRLNHVGLLTEDVNATIRFCSQMLGMRTVKQPLPGSKKDSVLLVDGSGTSSLALEVVGPPFSRWGEEMYSRSGPARDHLGFLVEALDQLRTKVRNAGVEIEWESKQGERVTEFAIRDTRGVVVRCISSSDLPIPIESPVKESSGGDLPFRLHHVSIVSDELDSLASFYQDVLGMKTVLDLKRQGILFLADPSSIAEKGAHTPCLEIIAPPGLWEREQRFLDRHGPGIDHLSFYVPDVDKAFEELSAKGAKFHVEPVDFEGTRLAFFKDPDGLDIEIELPNLPQAFNL